MSHTRTFAVMLAALALLPASPAPAREAAIGRIVVDVVPAPGVLPFRPDEAIGEGLDGGTAGDMARALTAHNVAAMRRAGLRPLTYRLRTELGIEAWHWNPRGNWSDAAHAQGYWTSSDAPGAPITLSWGYRLPRRGDTTDNANDEDYSRLTDGDAATFWKSNPYLDPSVLKDGEDHPQWLIVRLAKAVPIGRAVITWGQPYATRYEVQYWTGSDEDDTDGRWIAFPHGAVTGGTGGTVTLALADKPITARIVRVALQEGSHTAPMNSRDRRDSAGYAVAEVALGSARADGTFADAVVHAPSHTRQTFTHVSSTDPWHRASDRDPDLEQVGIDRIFSSGLGSGLPIMLPVPVLYDTPENAAAELRYVTRRGFPVRQIELGEEPDGQYAAPADYAALYAGLADRLRGIVPHAVFGGPSLQSAFTDTAWQPDAPGSWNKRFVDYLRRHDHLGDLGFASFEYYPFDDICGDIHAKLIDQTALLARAARRMDADGVPASVPRIITEYGFSAYSGRAMSEMPAALLMAGIVGQWLSQGGGHDGNAAYMFGAVPNVPINQHQPCAGYGNMMLHLAGPDGRATTPMPGYWTARLITGAWTVPGHGVHQPLPVRVEGAAGDAVVAYAVRRPDRQVSVMVINRDPAHAFRFALSGAITGPATVTSFGPAQYGWIDAGVASRPQRSRAPAVRRLAAGPLRITAAAYAITVVTGRAAELLSR